MKAREIIVLVIGGVLLIAVGIWHLFRPTTLSPQESLKKARAAHHNQQFSNAIATLNLCLKKYPKFSQGDDTVACSYRESGDLRNALSHHDSAIRINPHRFEYYWERGVTHMRAKDYTSAIADFVMCTEKNEQCANCYTGLAMALRQQGKLTEAIAQHDKAIALSPDRPDFYWERCVTYRQKGDTKEAERDLSKARRLGFGN